MTLALDRVFGHDRPRKFLRAVLSRSRVPTGFLFHGDRGRGKWTTAMSWLETLYCRTGVGCGTCGPCVKVAHRTHPDIELVGLDEGKAQIAIARVRELREWFSRAPFESERRAVVVDDADRMTVEAQNSLLKLLEEPPGMGHLVLISSDPAGLLETIRSRVQRVYFGPLDDDELGRALAALSTSPPAALTPVLPLAGGSVGRGLALLDDEATPERLEHARVLLDVRIGPFELGERLTQGQGRKVAMVREALLEVVAAAVEMAARHLEARLLARPVEALYHIEALDAVPVPVLEGLLQDLIEGRRRIDANVAPRLVVESLGIRIQRRLARHRKKPA